MGPLGFPELIFILVLALLIFGPRRLPEVGRTVGKALGEFRRATGELTRTLNSEVALEEERPRRSPSATPVESPEVTPGRGVATGSELAPSADSADSAADSDAAATESDSTSESAEPVASVPRRETGKPD